MHCVSFFCFHNQTPTFPTRPTTPSCPRDYASHKMHRYKIVPWILFILSFINVTLTAPVVLREIRHACVDVMDIRKDAIPVSRSEKQNYEMEKLWDKPLAAMYPRTSQAPSESGYESAPESLDSFRSASSEFQPASPRIKTPPSESSIEPESQRIHDGASSENYLASNEGERGSSKSFSFSFSNPPAWLLNSKVEPEPVVGWDPNAGGLATTSTLAEPKSGSQKSFLSKLVTKSKSFFSKLASKSANFFGKLAGKIKFWRRTSESVSA